MNKLSGLKKYLKYLEAHESYKSENKQLQEIIDTHNKCNAFSSKWDLKEYRFAKQFINGPLNDFFNTLNKNYTSVWEDGFLINNDKEKDKTLLEKYKKEINEIYKEELDSLKRKIKRKDTPSLMDIHSIFSAMHNSLMTLIWKDQHKRMKK